MNEKLIVLIFLIMIFIILFYSKFKKVLMINKLNKLIKVDDNYKLYLIELNINIAKAKKSFKFNLLNDLLLHKSSLLIEIENPLEAIKVLMDIKINSLSNEQKIKFLNNNIYIYIIANDLENATIYYNQLKLFLETHNVKDKELKFLIWNTFALYEYHNNNYNESLRIFKGLTKVGIPDYKKTKLYFCVGMIYKKQKKYKEAKDYFLKVIEFSRSELIKKLAKKEIIKISTDLADIDFNV